MTNDLCFRSNDGKKVRKKRGACDDHAVPQFDPDGKYITLERARDMCEKKYYEWDWSEGYRVCDGTPTSNGGKGWLCQMGTACRPPTEFFEQPVIENYPNLCYRNSEGGVRFRSGDCDDHAIPQKDLNGKYITEDRARELCEHNYYERDGSVYKVCDGTPTSNRGKGWLCQPGASCRPPS